MQSYTNLPNDATRVNPIANTEPLLPIRPSISSKSEPSLPKRNPPILIVWKNNGQNLGRVVPSILTATQLGFTWLSPGNNALVGGTVSSPVPRTTCGITTTISMGSDD